MSFFKTPVAARPAGPPISFISTCCEVPFRTVITGPPGSSPNRVVAKQRENAASAETFIVLIALCPFTCSTFEVNRNGGPLADLIALHSRSSPGRFPSVHDSWCSQGVRARCWFRDSAAATDEPAAQTVAANFWEAAHYIRPRSFTSRRHREVLDQFAPFAGEIFCTVSRERI